MATKTQKKADAQRADLSQILSDIKELSFDDRKRLNKIVNEAHAKDLDKNSYGGDPDGELYKDEPVEETTEK